MAVQWVFQGLKNIYLELFENLKLSKKPQKHMNFSKKSPKDPYFEGKCDIFTAET